MKNIIERFKIIIDEIQKNPLLELVEAEFKPPASEELIQKVEQAIGISLAERIRDFYMQTNGFKLHWRINPAIPEEEFEGFERKYDDYEVEDPYDEDEDIPFAQINIIPIEKSLLSKNWIKKYGWDMFDSNAKMEFSGKEYSLREFAKFLKPFDLFSTYRFMSFVFDEQSGNPKVMLIGDYGAEWDESRITDFESYIEMLLATRGIAESRERVYREYRGDKKPPLITGPEYWTKRRIPKLFR